MSIDVEYKEGGVEYKVKTDNGMQKVTESYGLDFKCECSFSKDHTTCPHIEEVKEYLERQADMKIF